METSVIFAIVTYLIYNCHVFYYVSKIFGTPLVKFNILLLLCAINSFLVFYPIYITQFHYEWLFMIVYFLVFGIEIFLVYKKSLVQTVSALLCFTINFFGIRVLVIGILSYMDKIHIATMLADVENRLFITTLTFLILTPYILVSSRILISKVVKYLFADIQSLKLAAVLLSTVCLNQFTCLSTIYIVAGTPTFNSWYQIRVSGLSLILFVIIMVLVYIYSKLKQAAITYKDTTLEMRTDSLIVEKLEAEAKTDFFTGFSVRSVAVEKLNEFIKSNEKSYALYIDLDGLKFVNDNFGHEEGDWYILNVCSVIKEVFSADTISRTGGDEFLIVGNNYNSSINDMIKLCYDKVFQLAEEHYKDYNTTISYGLAVVESNTSLNSSQIIEKADNAMYTFKRSRNKERKN